MFRKQKGITLIALVITIIVLLILAGVSINLVVGEGGILGKAQNAVTKTEEAKQKEQEDLDSKAGVIDNYLNNNPSEEPGNAGGENLPDVPEAPSGKTLLSQITSANYGDKVTYTANGVSDWKILYKDTTNVYIVASDYLAHGGSSDTSKIVSGTGMTKTGTYRAYWNSAPTSADTTNHIAKFSPVTAETKAWSGNYSTNSNGKCVSTLLDTTLWSAYASGIGGESAIGSPTLNMFVASWNEKYPSDKIYCNNDSTTGYYFGTSSVPTTYAASLSGKTGYGNTLYYPYQSVTSDSCYGYWLASPSANYTNYVMNVRCGGSVDYSSGYYDYVYGVRPVVSLSSSIKGTSTTTDGVTTWTLSN